MPQKASADGCVIGLSEQSDRTADTSLPLRLSDSMTSDRQGAMHFGARKISNDF